MWKGQAVESVQPRSGEGDRGPLKPSLPGWPATCEGKRPGTCQREQGEGISRALENGDNAVRGDYFLM